VRVLIAATLSALSLAMVQAQHVQCADTDTLGHASDLLQEKLSDRQPKLSELRVHRQDPVHSRGIVQAKN
jgi:hypothetical protein